MSRCQRCGKEVQATIISMFNRKQLCMNCAEKEQKHPKYKKATEAVHDCAEAGDNKFEGIGWDREEVE